MRPDRLPSSSARLPDSFHTQGNPGGSTTQTRYLRQPDGQVVRLSGNQEGNRFVGVDALGKRHVLDLSLVHESEEQALAAPSNASPGNRRQGLLPRTVSFPLHRGEPGPSEAGRVQRSVAIKAEPGPSPGRAAEHYVLVQTAPDRESLVPVKSVMIDLTQSQEIEQLELDWDKRSFDSRGRMSYMEALEARFFKRDWQDPTKVAAEWAHRDDRTLVKPATFEQPWIDADYAHVIFQHLNLTPEDAQRYSTPAERDKIREVVTREALADLVATAGGNMAPSASKSFVGNVHAQHIGQGEETLVEQEHSGLFASPDIGEGIQFLGFYALAEMTEAERKAFLEKHGYSSDEERAYSMNMPAPREGESRPGPEQDQTQTSTKRGKATNRPLIAGTAIGGGNKHAFANTATKEARAWITRYRAGKAPVKTRKRIKVTDQTRINAIFVPMIIPYISDDGPRLTAGMAVIGYNLEPNGPILVDYGPDYVRRQLNSLKPRKNAGRASAPTDPDAGVDDVRIKEEPIDVEMATRGMAVPANPAPEVAASGLTKKRKGTYSADAVGRLVNMQRPSSPQPPSAANVAALAGQGLGEQFADGFLESNTEMGAENVHSNRQYRILLRASQTAGPVPTIGSKNRPLQLDENLIPHTTGNAHSSSKAGDHLILRWRVQTPETANLSEKKKYVPSAPLSPLPPRVRRVNQARPVDNRPITLDSLSKNARAKAGSLPQDTVDDLIAWATDLRPQKRMKIARADVNPNDLLHRKDRLDMVVTVLTHLVHLKDRGKSVDLASLTSFTDKDWMLDDISGGSYERVRKFIAHLSDRARSKDSAISPNSKQS